MDIDRLMLEAARRTAEATEVAVPALMHEFGIADTLRFLNQFRVGTGDYTKDRGAIFTGQSVQELAEQINQWRAANPRPPKNTRSQRAANQDRGNRDVLPLAELNAKVWRFLVDETGVVNAIRFLGQFESGSGNYATDRDEWQKDLTVEQIVADIERQKDPNEK